MAPDRWQPRLAALLAGRYRVDGILGKGGMAIVYQGFDLAHEHPVAIKLLQPEMTTSVTAERFLREIQFTAQLRHPSILPVLDSGTGDALVYYVMPVVRGESLRDRLLWAGALPVPDAVAIGSQMASALQVAHDRGVVHRDLKPDNILIDGPTAYLTDFGVARTTDDDGLDRLTAAGMTVGTPAYMSPEQVMGGEVDHRSDIYSLGCVMFEALAGRPPFEAGSPAKVMHLQVAQPAPAVRSIRAELAAGIEEALARALAKVPDQRYQRVAEFGEALAGAAGPAGVGGLSSGPEAAPDAPKPSGVLGKLSGWLRRGG